MLLAAPYQQVFDPVADSFGLSSIFAVLPLLTLFVLLGGLKMKAWMAGLISLAVAVVVAIVVYGMPVSQTLLSASEGAVFGFFPILWVVINAIWVYNLTVATGHFDVLRRSFEKVSPDQRIQAVIIAFCFGGLLEALAGFGTPVAISVVMLHGPRLRADQGGDDRAARQHRAGRVRRARDPDRDAGGGHLRRAARQPRPDGRHPRRDGRPADAAAGGVRPAAARLRRRRQARPAPDLAAGAWSAVSRSPSASSSAPTTSPCRSPTSSPRRPVRSPSSPCCASGSRSSRPCSPSRAAARRAPRASRAAPTARPSTPRAARAARAARRRPAAVGAAAAARAARPSARAADGAVRDRQVVDSGAEVAKAYAPYVIIVAIFSFTNLPAVKEALAARAVDLQVRLAGPGRPHDRPASRRPARPTRSAGCPPPAR